MSKKESNLRREHAPIITSGFRMGIGEGFAVVDFIDAPDPENKRIVFSVGLTKTQAKNLANRLTEFVEADD